MAMAPILIRPVTAADLDRLHRLIESAYRGDSARSGWTHEADMIEGARTDGATLAAVLDDPREELLVAITEDGALIGCVQISDRGGGLAYLGLLAVDPKRQAGGLGRSLIAAAERHAAGPFSAARIEMTVVAGRAPLVAYYERRGYRQTGERRPFPILLDPPRDMIVLEKRLDA